VTAAGSSPELILSLSRDQVSIHLVANPAKSISAWQKAYPLTGLYLEDEIASALDKALTENPALFDDFTCVHLLITDRPNLLLPIYLKREGKIAGVAARHLRVRAGDALKLDENSGELVCYSLPKAMVFTVREYFSEVANIHLVSLLWKEIQSAGINDREGAKTVFYALAGKSLIVLGTEQEKLFFSRILDIHHQDDVQYYIVACNRLLKPIRKINIQLQEDVSPFMMLFSPHTSFDQRITFPAVPQLLQRHFPCAS
jgi:hypothetical protein